jgi:NADPH2:quinone reductase
MSVPATMKPITFANNGGFEVIGLTSDLPVPAPTPADVVIKVAYTGVNFIDTYFQSVVLFRHLTHT